MLTVVDQLSRQTPLLEPGFLFSDRDVVEALDRAIEQAGTLTSITVNHRTEFTSNALEERACRRSVKLDFTRPGKRTQNGHIEPWNGRLRDECLNVQQVVSLDDACQKIEAWRIHYIAHRPHSSPSGA